MNLTDSDIDFFFAPRSIAIVGASPWQIIGPADSVTMVKEDPFVGEHTPQIKAGAGIRIHQAYLGSCANGTLV